MDFGIATHKGLDIPDVLTILEEVIPCLHTGDCYNISDESTKRTRDFDRPPYSLREIRYGLLQKNYHEISTHIPAQTTPMYAAPILRRRSYLSQKSEALKFETHVL